MKSVQSASTSIKAATQHCLREGPLEVCTAGLRRMGLNYEGYWYYLAYRLKRRRGIPCVDESELFELLTVNPGEIQYRPRKRFDKWENWGEVRDGDWDRPTTRFENCDIYGALKQRFEDGREWNDIEYVTHKLQLVEQGETTWNGCQSPEDIWERCRSLDDLYERIRKEGFQSQSTVYGKSQRELILSGSFNRSKTDIAVHIARNGEFRFVDGNHRLSIAKLLGLETVPVRVVIRHTEWESIRETARAGGSESIPTKYRSHPDIESG